MSKKPRATENKAKNVETMPKDGPKKNFLAQYGELQIEREFLVKRINFIDQAKARVEAQLGQLQQNENRRRQQPQEQKPDTKPAQK